MNRYFEDELSRILSAMNEKGRFLLSLISTGEGLLISATSSDYDSETVAAIASLVSDTAGRVEKHLGFSMTDEVSVVDRRKVRLVCKTFETEGETFILVLLVPYKNPYRRISSGALMDIRACLRAYSKTSTLAR